jgi:hypothetical protein
MILIFSAFGPTKNYPDQKTMEKTLRAFVDSVTRQTDRRFKLFLVGHDKPKFSETDDVLWHSLSCEGDPDATLVPETLPKKVSDPLRYVSVPGNGKMGDMSRKVQYGTIRAVQWAYQNEIKEFWMMRMDSDDLLAIDTVAMIHTLDKMGIRAVFNRTCHMFDMKTKQIAIHHYPYSNTPNALKFKINDDQILTPDWFYLCMNHTLFPGRVRRDGIPCRELDFMYCITTNTGNSISGRPTLSKVEQTREVPLTQDLIDRYGIEKLI